MRRAAPRQVTAWDTESTVDGAYFGIRAWVRDDDSTGSDSSVSIHLAHRSAYCDTDQAREIAAKIVAAADLADREADQDAAPSSPAPDVAAGELLLPAPTSLRPGGGTIGVDELRARLEHLGRTDPETAHGVEDDAHLTVLRAIADGHPDPAGLAAAMVQISTAEFSRWRA